MVKILKKKKKKLNDFKFRCSPLFVIEKNLHNIYF